MKNAVLQKTTVVTALFLFMSPLVVQGAPSQNDRCTKGSTDGIVVPECVQPGDILLIDIKGRDESLAWKIVGPYNEHAALYVGDNMFIDASSQNGVGRHEYSHYTMIAKNLAFLRVTTADNETKNNAIQWAYDRIGSPYQDFLAPPWYTLMIADPYFPHPTAGEFFCLELVWAAYYNQGIDVFHKTFHSHFPVSMIFQWTNVTKDDDTEIIYTEVQDSLDYVKPNKGLYLADKKIIPLFNKTMVIGTIDVEVVTLNLAITTVDFYVNDKLMARDTTRPFGWIWNERGTGPCVVTSVASDDAGNSYSTWISVNKIL